MGGEGEVAIDRDAETVGLRHEGIDVGGVQPVAAEVERHARREILRVGAAADAVRGFDHLVREAGLGRGPRRADASGTGADDDEVRVRHASLSLNGRPSERVIARRVASEQGGRALGH